MYLLRKLASSYNLKKLSRVNINKLSTLIGIYKQLKNYITCSNLYLCNIHCHYATITRHRYYLYFKCFQLTATAWTCLSICTWSEHLLQKKMVNNFPEIFRFDFFFLNWGTNKKCLIFLPFFKKIKKHFKFLKNAFNHKNKGFIF